jgi:hypothetical protein
MKCLCSQWNGTLVPLLTDSCLILGSDSDSPGSSAQMPGVSILNPSQFCPFYHIPYTFSPCVVLQVPAAEERSCNPEIPTPDMALPPSCLWISMTYLSGPQYPCVFTRTHQIYPASV